MKLNYEKDQLTGKYDKRNLTISKSGKHRYPSKKIFVQFLKQFKDIPGTVDIWSTERCGEVELHVIVKYNPPELSMKEVMEKDALNRIKWDKNLNEKQYTIVYADRVLSTLNLVHFVDIILDGDFFVIDQTNDEGETEKVSVPMHRIRKIKKMGVTVWDKRKVKP